MRWLNPGHKAIGIRYFWLALAAALTGQALSLLMRFHVVDPTAKVAWWEWLWPVQAAGGVMTPELYLALMTIHGTLMVFFTLTLAPQSAFGSHLLPLQIGAPGMALPRLHAASYWITLAAFALQVVAIFATGGGPLSGWTAYPPLSAVGSAAGPGQGAGQSLWLASLGLFCVAALCGSANFVVTTLECRTRGMRFLRLPLPAWSWFLTALLSLPSFTILLLAALLLLADRHLGTSFFIPAGLVFTGLPLTEGGGSPLLWQHLFWFFGHPEVYIAILPAMGAVSQILADHARRPVFGYRTMVAALGAIAVLGMLVWGHHMFTSGLSPYARMAFSLLSIAVGVPSAVKTFHWIATIWGGRLRFTTAMLFALGFVSVFVTGGLSGIILAQLGLNAYFHDTYFVVAHFHFIMGVSAVFGIFAATYYWFPKMFGRLLDERLGKLHFYLTFLGVHLVFLPMHFLGLEGNPRRYPEFTEFEFLGRLLPLHEYITWGAFATGAVQLIFLGNLIYSRYRGPLASANPWQATTLEWIAPSPPPPENFPSGYPIVDHPPYAYETASEAPDYHTQADAYQESPTTGDLRQGLFFSTATIVMVWHAGMASALVFRRFAPDWSRLPASPALWWAAGLALAAAVLLRLSVRYPRLRLAAFPLALASCLAPALLPWQAAQGPALWFYSLIAGSQALFSLGCLYPLLRSASQPAGRIWYLIAFWWLLWAAALRLLA